MNSTFFTIIYHHMTHHLSYHDTSIRVHSVESVSTKTYLFWLCLWMEYYLGFITIENVNTNRLSIKTIKIEASNTYEAYLILESKLVETENMLTAPCFTRMHLL